MIQVSDGLGRVVRADLADGQASVSASSPLSKHESWARLEKSRHNCTHPVETVHPGWSCPNLPDWPEHLRQRLPRNAAVAPLTVVQVYHADREARRVPVLYTHEVLSLSGSIEDEYYSRA